MIAICIQLDEYQTKFQLLLYYAQYRVFKMMAGLLDFDQS